MKVDPMFPRQVVLVLLAGAALGLYPLIRIGSAEVLLAAGVGAALSTLNVIAGFLTIEYSFGKSWTTFLKAAVGGMGIRMLTMLGLMVLMLRVVQLDPAPFLISLLGFYAVFLVLEVLYLQSKVSAKNQG